MSTEEEEVVPEIQGVSFSVALEQQSFRLVELPPPLLELVASDGPPILRLKSAPAPNEGSVAPSAYLCTDDRTFEVRQVHSSNIIYILQTSEVDSNNKLANVAETGITAIGQCKALLELVPGTASAATHLQGTIPLYEGRDPSDKHAPASDRETFLADTPFSNGELEQAITQICAFEGHDGRLWLPTPTVLRNVWASFMSAVEVEGVKISEGFSIDSVGKLVKEDGHNLVVLEAVLARLRPKTGEVVSGFEQIDRADCVPWLGQVILDSRGLDGLTEEDLIKQWQDNLSEAWRNDAALKLLEGAYKIEGDSKLVSTSTVVKRQAALKNTPAPVALKAVSKWHEKFKASRK